jgi:hypothetical protein
MCLHDGIFDTGVDIPAPLASSLGLVAYTFQLIYALAHLVLILGLPHQIARLLGLLFEPLETVFQVHGQIVEAFTGLRSLMNGLVDLLETFLDLIRLHDGLLVTPFKKRQGSV